jgi:ubiquitin-protein ligase
VEIYGAAICLHIAALDGELENYGPVIHLHIVVLHLIFIMAEVN